MPSSGGSGSIDPRNHSIRSTQSLIVLGVAGPGVCLRRLNAVVRLLGGLISSASSATAVSCARLSATRLKIRPGMSIRSRLINRSKVLNPGRSIARGAQCLDSPMGRAMFTIIGAMTELESSLISERVTAGMRAAEPGENTWAGPPPNSASSVKSRHLLRQRTSAFARFKAKLLVGQAEVWSERSPSAPASNLPQCASPTSLEQTIRHEQSNDAAATKR